MPLIIISGYPQSGKTYRSKQIVEAFENLISSSTDPNHARLKIHLISDESMGIKTSVYATARAEKDARAEEMSAVKRLLSKDNIVIADGLNYIKGFRYQLYCEAKALGTPSCVVHVGTPIETCRANNDALQSSTETGKRSYASEDFENLVFRYEEPNAMARWDSPLYTVVWDDKTPPINAIWEAIIGGSGAKKVVRPHAATVLKPATQQDYLYELDKGTSDIVSAITSWQRDHVGESGGSVVIPECEESIELPTAALTLPMLQRIRRQFIALNRQHNLDKERVQPLFIDYLNDQFKIPS